MQKLYPVILLVFLISCGGGDATTPQFVPTDICSPNNTTHAPIDTNSIKVSVEKVTHTIDLSQRSVPAENVVVQLNNQGPCMRTNKDGFVTFTALSNEPHDIHIFSPKGHQWVSEYSISPGKLKRYNIGSDTTITQSQESYATLSGSFTNKTPGTLIDILIFFPDGQYRQYKTDVSDDTNSYSVEINSDVKPGFTLSIDIIALEYQNNPATGDSFIIDTKVYKNFNFTAGTTKNTHFAKLDIDFPVPKTQQLSKMLSFNTIALPLGLGLKTIHVNSYSPTQTINSSSPFFSLFFQTFNQNIPALNLSLPITFSAYDQFKLGKYRLELVALPSNGGNDLQWWRYLRSYSSTPGPYSVAPKITVFPTISDNLSGDVISWDSVDANLTAQSLQFYSKKGKLTWHITLAPSTTSIRLPNRPKGINTRLFSNQNFGLLGKLYSPATEELEQYKIASTTWSPN